MNKFDTMIKKFEDYDVVMITNDNHEIFFELYSVGAALGYARTVTTKGKEYFNIRKDRIDKVIKNAEIPTFAHDGQTFLTETNLYDFMFEAKTDKCRAFRKWLAEEVMDSLMKNDFYIGSEAKKEEVDFDMVYGKNKIYDTFFNSNDPNADYEEFKKLAKEKRDRNHHAFNNQDRISLSKKIIDALENKARYAIASKEPIYKIMSYQELANKIQQDITSLTNQRQGGLRAQQTRKINKLRVQNEELTFKLQDAQKELEYYALQPQSNVEFLEIPYYGFSNNKMYEPDKNRFKRTRAYNAWCNNFPKYLLRNKSFTEHVDFTKEVCIEMFFKTNGLFDVDNFSKPLLDVIANALNINDKVFTKTICCECNEKVKDHYKDGRIYIRMYNYDPAKLEK